VLVELEVELHEVWLRRRARLGVEALLDHDLHRQHRLVARTQAETFSAVRFTSERSDPGLGCAVATADPRRQREQHGDGGPRELSGCHLDGLYRPPNAEYCDRTGTDGAPARCAAAD
jgi:hypothetical protein